MRPILLPAVPVLALALIVTGSGGGAASTRDRSWRTASASADPGTPPPTAPVLRRVSLRGDGCGDDTASIAISGDRTVFTVTYSAFVAQAGPESQERTKSCTLVLRVERVPGYTFAVTKVDTRGYANLAAGASAVHTVRAAFPGSVGQAASTTLTGPLDDFWSDTVEYPVDTLQYAPCDDVPRLTVRSQLWVRPGTSPRGTTSFVAVDSTDTSTSVRLQVRWKSC